MKKIYVSVTNDLVADQRVNRVALTLNELGIKVHLIGRKLKHSYPINNRSYSTFRFVLPFNKGVLFYASYNIYLFFYLLFKKTHILWANDLDSLPANYLISKLKGIPLVFDSHEYFTEVPELVNRNFVKKIWLLIEKSIVPNLKHCITVCNSIAYEFEKKYGTKFVVVRNLPLRKSNSDSSSTFKKQIEAKTIIYQGALNIGRGIEVVIQAMLYIENTNLIIAGDGDIKNELIQLSKKLNLSNRVTFLGKISLNELHNYTKTADLGFSLEENMGLNYYYALPNKLFDYIQAEIPVLTSNFPEMEAIVTKYSIGRTTGERNPEKIATLISEMLADSRQINIWKQNLKIAAEELVWENEKKILIDEVKKTGILN